MKINCFKWGIFTILVGFLFVGCSQQDLIPNEDTSSDIVTISIKNLPFINYEIEEGSTRALVDINGSTMLFFHENGDSIGLFPANGYQIPFAVELPQGVSRQETVNIGAKGWNTKPGVEYAAYFPFVYEYKDNSALPFSFLGQMQTSPSDLTHLGEFSYRYSSMSQYDEVEKKFSFDMKSLGTVMQMKMKVPEGAQGKTWHKVVLQSSGTETFVLKGTVNLFSVAVNYGEVTPAITSSSISILLDDFVKVGDSADLNIYLMLPEFTLRAGESLNAFLYDIEGNAYAYTRTAVTSDKTYARNTFSALRFNLVDNSPIETGTNTSSANLDNQLNEMDAENTPVKTITIGDNSPKVDAINIPSGVSQSGSSEVNITFQNPVTTTAANTSNTIVVTDNSAANAPVQTESLSDVNLKFAENTGASEVPSLDINLPSSTVTLAPTSGVTHFNVVTTKTARNTLVIKSGVDINKLYVAGGNVVIEAGAHVGEIINSVGAGSTITDWNNGGSTEGSVTATVNGYTSGN